MDKRPIDSQKRQQYKWMVSETVLQRGRPGTFDDVAVKDPSIVEVDGVQHLFYTSKGEATTSGYPSTYTSIGYVAADSLSELKNAPRLDLNAGGRLCPKEICAPQVLYFSPHKLWYLIAQAPARSKWGMFPIYMTNPDISNPEGWSKPEVFSFQRKLDTFWIDFWVIADDEGYMHFFYTDHNGSLFRQETRMEDFPYGFSVEQEVAHIVGEDSIGPWRLHEASHIYKLKEESGYLAILEAVRPHPLDPTYWDSRTRFMFAMHSDSLRGPWKRIESQEDTYWGDPKQLYDRQGRPAPYNQVSHPEVIRMRHDETLAISDIRADVLMQAFNASGIDAAYRYDFLPWELLLMTAIE